MDTLTQRFPNELNMQFLSMEELEMIEGGISFGEVMYTCWTGGTAAVGALAGAAAGSAIVPGAGTYVGAFAGGVTGTIVGDRIWKAVFK